MIFKTINQIRPLTRLIITRQCNFINETLCKGLFMYKKNVDWNDLQLFISVAREGGLSAAAKMSQRSPATLGRRMYALERSLGKELFIRHDRGYELLADGKKLLEELTSIESKLVSLTMESSSDKKPLVKISAGTWTTLFLIQHLDQYSDMLDNSLIRFISTEKTLDITHREIVIGIRNSRPIDDSLVCRKLNKVEFAPYSTSASPELWIKVLTDIPSGRWLDRYVGNNSICEVSVPRNSLDIALEGKGIALLPTFIGDTEPTLKRVGKIIDELSHEQWLVTHHEDRYLPEVRNLINRLGKILE